MDLSTNIVKQFAEIVGNSETPSNGTTVYGTIVESNGTRCVKIDGSDEVTPVSTAVSIAPGERVLVLLKNHTATVTGNVTDPSASARKLEDETGKLRSEIKHTVDEISARVENVEEGFAEVKITADEISQKVESYDEAMSEIKQTAENITSTIKGYDEAISKVEQTATEITSKVEQMEEEFTQISQTAKEVRIEARDENGNVLSTAITNEGTWEAIYKVISDVDGTEKIRSGFYFDFASGQFVYDGTGIFRSEDSKTFIKIENDGLTLYTDDGRGNQATKIHIGVQNEDEGAYAGDYPYIQLGAGGENSRTGLIKKFWDGLFIGNDAPKMDSGPFVEKAGYAGIFVDTVNEETYVVRGNKKEKINTGGGTAKFK